MVSKQSASGTAEFPLVQILVPFLPLPRDGENTPKRHSQLSSHAFDPEECHSPSYRARATKEILILRIWIVLLIEQAKAEGRRPHADSLPKCVPASPGRSETKVLKRLLGALS